MVIMRLVNSLSTKVVRVEMRDTRAKVRDTVRIRARVRDSFRVRAIDTFRVRAMGQEYG